MGIAQPFLEDVRPAPPLLAPQCQQGGHCFAHLRSAVAIGHARVLTRYHRKRVRRLWGMQEHMSQCGQKEGK